MALLHARRAVAAALLLPALLAFTAARAQPAWPPATDIPPDPSVVPGVLENGLRYALLVNHEPRGRASLRLLVGAGSLDEKEAERGFAHYLEHMAFNGTENFAADTLVEWFQRNGMSFGGDSNARTSFETTTYLLELPRADEAALAEGLRVLRDFADGMLLSETEVEKERGIILAEKRARDSVEFRTTLAEFAFVLPGTLPPERFPIGVDETLHAADAAGLRAFYERWYRPENMIVAIAGEIDPVVTEVLIHDAFGSMRRTGPLPPRADRGPVTTLAAPIAAVHREAEASSVSVSLQVVAPYEKQPDSIATRLRDLPLDVANAIINRRLSELAKREDAPFNFGAAGSIEAFDFAEVASMELTGPPEKWKDALALAEQELRRALEYGFAPAEVREISANILNSLDEAVRAAPTRRSPGLAGALATSIWEEQVFITPETNRVINRPAVEALTPEICLSALRAAWAKSAPRLFVSGRLPEDVTAKNVLEQYRASAAQAVDPPVAPKDDAFAYNDFGPPGEILARRQVEDLDLVLVEFANGVRLNLKRTDFSANSISLSARFGGGRLELPRDRPELVPVAGALVNEGGLGRHSKDDLRRILAGRSVGLSFGIADDTFLFRGGASPKDVDLALQLLCAYLTDPGWRADSLPLIRRSIAQAYERMLHVPSGVAGMKIPALLASGDPRFATPPLEDILRVSAGDVRAALEPAFSHAALEVALVGDFDVEHVLALAARTLGALPERAPQEDYAAERHVAYPEVPPSETFAVDTEIEKALVLTYWPTTDARDIPRTRRLGLLASIFDDRLRKVVREELGAAYSPNASSAPSDAYPGYGLFSVAVEVDPPQASQVQEAILRLAEELRSGGVTADELERAREPALTAIRQSVRQNGYWLNAVVDEAQSRPEFLEAARTREADFSSISQADLDALAAAYLRNERAARFLVRPEEAGSAVPMAPR